MRFDRRTANRIVAGRKTEHRIPRDTETFQLETGHIMPVTVMRPNPDLGYRRKPKNGEAKPRQEGHTVCHVRLLGIETELLHEMPAVAALAEGFRSRGEFLEDWWERHRNGPGIEGSNEYPVEIPVWVLRFELDASHHPRLLARASDVARGYTESPAAAVDPTEPEAVEDRYLDRFAIESEQDKAARLLAAEQRIQERALEDRLAEVRRRAARDGVDISSPLRVIERQLQKAEGRLHGKAA